MHLFCISSRICSFLLQKRWVQVTWLAMTKTETDNIYNKDLIPNWNWPSCDNAVIDIFIYLCSILVAWGCPFQCLYTSTLFQEGRRNYSVESLSFWHHSRTDFLPHLSEEKGSETFSFLLSISFIRHNYMLCRFPLYYRMLGSNSQIDLLLVCVCVFFF